VRDGVAYVSNFADRHVYRIVEGTEPEVVTPGKLTAYLELLQS
jgi:hypothetical protein